MKRKGPSLGGGNNIFSDELDLCLEELKGGEARSSVRLKGEEKEA